MATMGAGGPKPTQDQCKQFLKTGLAVMTSKATRDILMDPAIQKPGEHLKELQRSGWDSLGFDRDVGCKALDEIDVSESELGDLKMEFMFTSMKCYLTSLEDRRPPKLQNTKRLPRNVIIEFFDACNVKMQYPEFQKELVKYVEEHRQPPNQIIIDAQRAMLETLGFEADHGCAQLSNIGEDYKNDPEMLQRMRQWGQVAMQTCQKITASVVMSSMPEKTVKRFSEAREFVAKMSREEAEALVQRMCPKVEALSKLPTNAQEEYMEKQPEDLQNDLVRTQIIMHGMRMAQMRSQAMQQGDGGEPVSAAAMPGSKVSKPSQQQMM